MFDDEADATLHALAGDLPLHVQCPGCARDLVVWATHRDSGRYHVNLPHHTQDESRGPYWQLANATECPHDLMGWDIEWINI